MNGLALYGRYVAASLRAQAQYPAATFMLAAGHCAATAIEIIGVYALFHRFGSVGGWSFGEAALFYALVNITFSIADILSRGFDVFGTDFVRTGAFDRILLRPRAAALQLAGYEIRLSRFGRRFPGGLAAEVLSRDGPQVTVRFNHAGTALMAKLGEVGHIPLPPYIQRADDADDRADYQTIYAAREGAIAAPTAGLHFTPALLGALDTAGIHRAHVTLHVGAGTFLPVSADDTADHKMHAEWGEIGAAAATAINAARAAGGRIVAVGTTALRLLESAADADGRVLPYSGDTSIFITPGVPIKTADVLMTNFHLPRSTLYMLVCAFAGMERMRAAYTHAIANGYRFYSYGDTSLLERNPAS